jgi:hypothetical protein
MAYDPAFNIPPWKIAVDRSHAYYMGMKDSLQYRVIDSYRGEIDADDWQSAPLLISYRIMNWAMKKIHKNSNGAGRNYLPELLEKDGLEQSGITGDTLIQQVEHAKILEYTLHTFPKLENTSMTVYRGETCNSFYYQKAANMEIGNELVILPFLSTSINPNVANRFTGRESDNNACMWEITIPQGTIFPYVSDFKPEQLGNQESARRSEQEVLLPTHARLKLLSKTIDQWPRIYRFQLIGFAEKSPDFWDRIRENLLSVPHLPPPSSKTYSPVRRSTRVIPSRKPYGGGTKTRKRTKRNRKSRRKVRK